MLARRISMMLLVLTMTYLGTAACAPSMNPDVGAGGTSSASTPTPEGVVSSEGIVASEEVTATTPSGSEAGAASGEPQAGEDTGEPVTPAALILYADSTYKFSVEYPGNFVFRSQPAEKLAQLKPMPEAAFLFINPTIAASDLGDLEPADLEIRVYSVAEVESLENWLSANELLPPDTTAPETFQTDNVDGFRVCSSTMVAPGCSNFVMSNGFVYQLTPATLEGESMIETLMLTP